MHKNMNRPRTRPARQEVCERLSQGLEEFLARERMASQAEWALIETEKMTRARRALFGCAPK